MGVGSSITITSFSLSHRDIMGSQIISWVFLCIPKYVLALILQSFWRRCLSSLATEMSVAMLRLTSVWQWSPNLTPIRLISRDGDTSVTTPYIPKPHDLQ